MKVELSVLEALVLAWALADYMECATDTEREVIFGLVNRFGVSKQFTAYTGDLMAANDYQSEHKSHQKKGGRRR